jgi:hypothetical protein
VFPVAWTGLDFLSVLVLLVLAAFVRLARHAAITPATTAFPEPLADLDRRDLGAGAMLPLVTALAAPDRAEGLVADLPALLADLAPATERRSTDPAALAVLPWLADESVYGEEAQPPPVALEVMTAARLFLILLMLLALLYRLAQG